MMKPAAAAIACVILAAGSGALAAEEISTSFHQQGKGKNASYAVTFFGECGAECVMAEIACESTGAVTFTYADVEAQDASKAILVEGDAVTITVSGTAHGFTITELTYTEMTGAWWVAARAGETQSEFMAALPKAKSMTAAIQSASMILPVTKDVQKWVKACSD